MSTGMSQETRYGLYKKSDGTQVMIKQGRDDLGTPLEAETLQELLSLMDTWSGLDTSAYLNEDLEYVCPYLGEEFIIRRLIVTQADPNKDDLEYLRKLRQETINDGSHASCQE